MVILPELSSAILYGSNFLNRQDNNNNKKDAKAAYRPYGYASYAIGNKDFFCFDFYLLYLYRASLDMAFFQLPCTKVYKLLVIVTVYFFKREGKIVGVRQNLEGDTCHNLDCKAVLIQKCQCCHNLDCLNCDTYVIFSYASLSQFRIV